jgi:hypothetical protein
MNKKAQEEIVGFAVILIIVAVVIVVALGFMIRKDNSPEVVESYEVGAFIQSILKYTSSCEGYYGLQNIQELIISCERGINCLDTRNSCEMLNYTLNELITSSWNVGQEAPVKGYKFSVKVEDEEILLIQEGNQTRGFKSSLQDFSRNGEDYRVSLRIYT